MTWFYCLIAAFGMAGKDAAETTDWMKPATWRGNFWGPAATRARSTGELPPLPTNPAMTRWADWGKAVLRDGDVVFRLGDAKALGGAFPLSRFISAATGSRFSHTGIVALEEGSPVVYDCSSDGVQRQPFEVWMLDCVGDLGVKRLRAEHRKHVAGILGYCREQFERQLPFDFEFRPDDAAFYCVELTEKAYRSQGLKLAEPVRIGDWENLGRYPLTAVATPFASKLFLTRPISLEQPVYLPGNDREGVWSSPLLENVYSGETRTDARAKAARIDLRGDLDMIWYAVASFRNRVNAVATTPVPAAKPQAAP
ncbi:YiiX/YebB-like N1pC/P60 family cysteine hydrolase [Paludisphaera mucosa]|uniref:YiiX/YebB-like N1pC/P60 family cysteine hydrolase n=1 Tax=Paludisphaera mucosa TaxID=3030827 RepID=A0ABT6FJM9_9BACT|nr:YiiX/YebB-like N1pC/P60 family cysteine hydrolase [Paludisphaera mucosa]MDG3007749.1 YiiX/YebB-like N1pC/P60 family cysteine hydrolase [Paludisphaera mucosa]